LGQEDQHPPGGCTSVPPASSVLLRRQTGTGMSAAWHPPVQQEHEGHAGHSRQLAGINLLVKNLFKPGSHELPDAPYCTICGVMHCSKLIADSSPNRDVLLAILGKCAVLACRLNDMVC
jgi:hypothetical protein